MQVEVPDVALFNRQTIWDPVGFRHVAQMQFTEHEVRAIAVMLEAGAGVVGNGYTARVIVDQFTKAYRDVQRTNLK